MSSTTWQEPDVTSQPVRNQVYAKVDGGSGNFYAEPVGGTVQSDGLTALNVAIVSGGGGGGGGTSNTVAATNPGTSATTANPIQGVTNGVPVPVSGTFFQTTQPVSIATLPALTAGSALIGAVNLDLGGTAVSSSNPIPTSPQVAGAAISSTNPLPVQSVGPLVSSSASLTPVTASATTVVLKTANASRKGLIVVNDSASSTMYLAFAATATTSAYTQSVAPSTSFYNTSGVIYTGTVSAIWTDTNTVVGNARITELT